LAHAIESKIWSLAAIPEGKLTGREVVPVLWLLLVPTRLIGLVAAVSSPAVVKACVVPFASIVGSLPGLL
jgi:hypothetical protein